MGRPIINYIGNKYRYGKVLDDLGLIPKQIDNYVEPFVGGAGFLCYLNETRTIKKIIINDKDCMLVNFYKHFKKSPEKFKEVLNNKTTETSFKKHKETLSNFKPTLESAIAYFVIKNCSYNSVQKTLIKSIIDVYTVQKIPMSVFSVIWFCNRQ